MSTPDPTDPPLEADDPVAAVPPAEPAEPASGASADEATEPARDPVLERLEELGARISESQRLIERQTEVAANLHAENQELRAGELRRAQQSLVFAVLRVYDDVCGMAATTDDGARRRDLELVADALADALERNGVEVAHVEPGLPFDPRRHKVDRVVPSPDPAADRMIAEVARAGFEWSDGDAIRAARVVVYKHAPAPVPEPRPPAATSAA